MNNWSITDIPISKKSLLKNLRVLSYTCHATDNTPISAYFWWKWMASKIFKTGYFESEIDKCNQSLMVKSDITDI